MQRRLDESEQVYEERYQRLLSRPKDAIARHDRGRSAARGGLKPYWVTPHQKPSPSDVAELRRLIMTAGTERPIHEFLERRPHFLTGNIQPAHHGQFCISKPRLGAELVPDFFAAGLDSGGLWWYGVELENPNESMFQKDGDLSAALSHALRQIEDWRSWLRDNIAYAQQQLGLVDIDADLPCYVIIGRRGTERLANSKLSARRRAVQKRDKSGLILHHYEWLVGTELANKYALPPR